MGFVMVPTPGPNSTNTSARPQFTGARIFSIRKREDGITEPTITGFFRNPRANMVRGPGRRDLPIALPSARPAPNADINCSLTSTRERRSKLDRKSVVEGKRVSVRVDLGGRRIHKKNRKK